MVSHGPTCRAPGKGCELVPGSELARLRSVEVGSAERAHGTRLREIGPEQNARVVQDAEAYYRAMFQGGAASWNLRDRHMMTTLESLLGHVGGTRGRARAVVWAHNSSRRCTRDGHGGAAPTWQVTRFRGSGRRRCSS